MNYQEEYKKKLITIDQALDLVRDGDVIATSAYGTEAACFMNRLHEVARRVNHLSVWSSGSMARYPYLTDPTITNITMPTFFNSEYARTAHATKRIEHIPSHLHSYESTSDCCDWSSTFYLVGVCPMDANGKFRHSLDCQATKVNLERRPGRIIIAAVNRNIPVVYGDNEVDISNVDYIIEGDYPLCNPPVLEIKAVEREIAANVVSLVKDGDCIQLGIGGMPNAVGEALLEKKELGIHTEMLTSSMGRLMKAGAVTNEHKNIDRGLTTCAFIHGDQELYDYVDHNEMVSIRRSSYTNDPAVIAKIDNMVSINTTLQMDLTGQACSESIGCMQYTGTGGASDFAYGAYHSKGGKGILAFASTANTKNGVVSKIAPILTPGSIVSIQRNIVDYVITEYGIAPMRGRSVSQRVKNLISIAHPDFRAELQKEADKYMIW